MRLVAMMPVRNERNRYLPRCIESLQEFCDEIRVLDDGSTDGSFNYLRKQSGVEVLSNSQETWAEHEGRFRQTLLDWTREGNPTHILAIDADEFVVNGKRLRRILERQDAMSFGLNMREVWSTDPWLVREDGGWKSHDVSICFRCPDNWNSRQWRIVEKQMAGGRVPRIVQRDRRGFSTGIDILHLGWSRPRERQARFDRYAKLDGGKFHAGSHIDSIMWSDRKCDLEPYEPGAMRTSERSLGLVS